jgi:hypothetical protein
MAFGKWQWAQTNKNPLDYTEWDIWSYTNAFMQNFLSVNNGQQVLLCRIF